MAAADIDFFASDPMFGTYGASARDLPSA